MQVAPARGIVLLDEQPLAEAFVTFTPEIGRSATGKTASDGTFVLATYGSNDGAVVGAHRTTVTAREGGATTPSSDANVMKLPGRSLIPTKYENSATSGLTFEVKAGAENEFKIRLTSKGVDK